MTAPSPDDAAPSEELGRNDGRAELDEIGCTGATQPLY